MEVELEKYEEQNQLQEDINWSKKFAEKLCNNTTFQVGINLGIASCAANFDPNKKMVNSDYYRTKI